MFILFSFCSCHWLIPWLLPFLLGLLLGWLLWGRFKKRVAELEDEAAKLKTNISELETDLGNCRNDRSSLESEIALQKGRIREMESEIERIKEEGVSDVYSSSSDAIDDASQQQIVEVEGDDLESDSGDFISKAAAVGGLGASLTGVGEEGSDDDSGSGSEEGQEDSSEEKGDNGDEGSGLSGEEEINRRDKKYESESPASDDESSSGDDSASETESASGRGVGADDIASGIAAMGGTGALSGSGDTGSGAGGTYGISADKFARIPSDNLQIIEGVGPKMESLLNEHGITDLRKLGDKSGAELQNILDGYGDRYRIIDPKSWPAQARLATGGNWGELIKMQRQMESGGRARKSASTEAKVEKVMVKLGLVKKWKENDLKAIEGIGPKIAGLLNDAGINTWRELSNTAVSRIQGILDEAGDRYRLADPTTWPRQSGMAADGRWEELERYQDELKGGRSS